MARILVASITNGIAVMERLLGEEHELLIATTMAEAVDKLEKEDVDLIMIGVHFDDSRMFDLMSQCKTITKNANKPIISFCTRDTPLTRTMHDSIDLATKALGAWIYLDQHDYNVKRNPDAEVRRVIERCLVSTERKKTKEKRADIQKQREELLRLRLALDAEEWSIDLEDKVADLRQKLSDVLLELSQAQSNSVSQQTKLAESKDLEDRVSHQVRLDENITAREERQIMLEESQQLAREQEIAKKEEVKARRLRHRLMVQSEQNKKAAQN